MSKKEKLIKKLAHTNKTFAWSDLVTLLTQLGFEKFERAGSRVAFIHCKDQDVIHLHKPHPEGDIKGGALSALKRHLSVRGDL